MTREWAERQHRHYHRLTRLMRWLRDRRGSSLPLAVIERIDARQRRIRLDAEAGGWNIENPFELRERERPRDAWHKREVEYAKRRPHTFEPCFPNKPWTAAKNDCRHCGQGPGASIHLLKLELEIDEPLMVPVEEDEDVAEVTWAAPNPAQGSLFDPLPTATLG